MKTDEIKVKQKYTYEIKFGQPTHVWSVSFRLGGIHLTIRDSGENAEYGRYHGGLELHRATPPDFRQFDAPDHSPCWLLGVPCWHDGSSLVVEETWIPIWQAAPTDNDRMLDMLKGELFSRFSDDMEDEA